MTLEQHKRITVGRIGRPFGVKGWVKLQSFTRPIDNLLGYRDVWLAKGEGFAARMVEGKVHGGGIVARLMREAAGPASIARLRRSP